MEASIIRFRERSHPFVFFALCGVLAVLAAGCVVLLVRAHRLHHDLDLPFKWLGELDEVHGELERLRTQETISPPADQAALERFPVSSQELAARIDEPGAQASVQALRAALADLRRGIDSESAELVWNASSAALEASAQLEVSIRGHMAQLHRQSGQLRNAVNLLLVLSLLLSAANLVVLFYTHRRERQLEEAHDEALEMASHDPLTGLWNRSSILRLLDHELVRAQRTGAPLSVILADLDNFRKVNAMLGQDQGDDVLREVGQRLRSVVRGYDTLGRFGGDSFLLVLPNCDEPATDGVVTRLSQAVNESDIRHGFGKIRVFLRLSGRTVRRPKENTVDSLLLDLWKELERSKAAASLA